MKKVIIALTLISGLFMSCNTDDVQDRPIIEAADASVITAPEDGGIYELDFNEPTALVDRFVWTDASFGGDVQITYALEMDMNGSDFANPQVLGSAIGANQLAVTTETFNGAAILLGATPFSATAFQVRIKATVSDAVEAIYSAPINITITPYTTEAPKIAVPGNHQGWDPASAPVLAASAFGLTDYEGYVWLDGGHKFIAPDSNGDFAWGNVDWGDDGSFSGVLLADGETDCTATAGYYFVTVDTEALTYNEAPANWGVIGAATPTGWDSDTDLVYDAASQTLSVDIDMVAGGWKFRANDEWGALEFGSLNDDGYLQAGGDFTFDGPAGNYHIVLDLSNPREYTYSITQN